MYGKGINYHEIGFNEIKVIILGKKYTVKIFLWYTGFIYLYFIYLFYF